MDVTNSEEFKRVQRREAARAAYMAKQPAKGGKNSFLRVIGGDLRSRKINFRLEESTRPMKDRTREAIFNLLGYTVADSIAIDLFAGSGILAFESLSRGAAFGVVIEKQSTRTREIKDNAARIDVASKMKILTGDTFRISHNPSKLIELLPGLAPEIQHPWMIFCCPPYSMWTEQTDQLTEMIDRWMQAAPVESSIIIELEHATANQFMFERDDYTWIRRDYRPATVAIGTRTSL